MSSDAVSRLKTKFYEFICEKVDADKYNEEDIISDFIESDKDIIDCNKDFLIRRALRSIFGSLKSFPFKNQDQSSIPGIFKYPLYVYIETEIDGKKVAERIDIDKLRHDMVVLKKVISSKSTSKIDNVIELQKEMAKNGFQGNFEEFRDFKKNK